MHDGAERRAHFHRRHLFRMQAAMATAKNSTLSASRDAKLLEIGKGTVEILRMLISGTCSHSDRFPGETEKRSYYHERT